MSSGMSTPVSLADTSTPLSFMDSMDELLELDKVDNAFQGDDDLQSRVELAERSQAEALLNLQETQQKLEALETKHEKFVEANEAFTQWRDDMERQRDEWAIANAKFAKRHLENKAARRKLEVKHSLTASALGDVSEKYAKAQEEIDRLRDQIGLLSSSASATVPDVERDQRDCLTGYDQCLTLSVSADMWGRRSYL